MKKLFIVVFLLVLLLVSCDTKEECELEHVVDPYILEEENLLSDYVSFRGKYEFLDNEVYFYHTASGVYVEFFGRIVSIDLNLSNKRNDIYFSLSKDKEDILE
jgi:hypothetical protein